MSDELRFCFPRCCHFVNNQPVTKVEYEKAFERNKTPFGLPGPVEALIPCRNDSGFTKNVENSVRFYLGAGMRRAFGTLIADGKMPSVFDSRNDQFLREATAEDTKLWRDAWAKEVEKARAQTA
jgi:hypothetical protein